MKSTTATLLQNHSSILKKVYLLLALLIISASLVAAILVEHLQAQQVLHDKINRFHAPTIHYTDKLISTLQNIEYTISQNKGTAHKRELIDLLNNHVQIIQTIAASYPNFTTERTEKQLLDAVNKVSNVSHDSLIIDQDETNRLPRLIESALVHVEQLNHLHVNLSAQLHEQLVEHEKNNTSFFIQLAILVFILAGFLIVPILINIHRMVGAVQNAEQLQLKLRETAELERSRMWALLSAMNIGVLFEDKQGRIEFVNRAFNHMWAIDINESLAGQRLNKLLEFSPQHFAYQEYSSKYVFHVTDSHKTTERFEIEFNNGRILTQHSFPVIGSGQSLLGRLWLYEDISHQRKTTQQLLYLAEHDPLTGLNNRHQFQKQLSFMLSTSQRTEHKFALLYFDLDDFKYINDTFGHHAGDNVLQRTASKIGVLVREKEMFARLGGDEFALIATLGPHDDIGTLPTRIINAITSIPFRFRDTDIRITASVGIAIFPDHGSNIEELVAHADSAMYQAKNLGKNTWSIYKAERKDSAKMVARMNWNRRISQALESDLFEIHFQGIYHTETLKISHLEVLIRMRDPDDSKHLIMPATFIPFAEKSAQIVDIDRWVLDHSIALLAAYPELPPLGVNISGRSFDEPTLPLYIKERIAHYGINPARLIIELTETEAVSDLHDAQHFIEIIRQTGCKICLDDFGSGFSSFAYLKYLNVEILKIDGIFIQDLTSNYENQVFVKAMVSIAQGLGKSLVAEYVENTETLQLLQELGVQFVQGYHLDRPVNQSAMLALQGADPGAIAQKIINKSSATKQ